MRILYLKDSFEPKYSMRDDVQVAVQAMKRGHDVTVMTSIFDLDLNPHPKSFFETQDKTLGIEVIRCKSFKIPIFPSMVIYAPNTMVFDKYDIVHAHNMGSYSSFLAGMLKSIKKVPMTFKADFSEVFYKRLKENYLLRKVVLKPAHVADALYTFTAPEKDLLVDLGIPEDKIWIIPIGINYDRLSNLKKEDTDSITVGYLGRFTAQKGLHNVVKPLKKLMSGHPNIKVVFAGQKTDVKYADKILRELEKHAKFKYAGFTKSSEDFYSQTDIVIAPSLWETGSIVTLEAMAAGKAVIASDINPHREYIDHGFSGFLAKDNNDFYKYLKELIDNSDLIKTLGKNAQKKAKGYDWKNVFAKVEKMYNYVISKSKEGLPA